MIIKSCKNDNFESSSRFNDLSSFKNELGTVRITLEKSNNFFLSSILVTACEDT